MRCSSLLHFFLLILSFYISLFIPSTAVYLYF
jgi:hypothetical protein